MLTLMSKGPGRIERALAEIFDSERDNAFTLDDLCERIYPAARWTETKHRISIARAARSLAKRRPEIQFLRGHGLGGALVFFRHDEVMSYAMARLKADRFERYRNNDPRIHPSNVSDEADLRRKLNDDHHCALVGQGGAWRRHVDIFLAGRAGDVEKAERLKAEGEAALAATLAGIKAAFGRRAP
jgi:hypothetical protein